MAGVAWVVAQLVTAADMGHDRWPLQPMTMFSRGRDEHVDLQLEGEARDGRRLVVEPGDFGLEAHQLAAWLAERIDPTDESGRAVLGRLAAIWNRSHPEAELVGLVLWQRRTPVPEGRPERRAIVLDWQAA